MQTKLKLGSLFDGIGGFPLVAEWYGIEPVWASEIESAPISITKRHFPNMKHLGDICGINGGEIEPVDIITGGSPCQDLSVAGKRAGLEGERSGLFMEMIRIIREMRSATNGVYPRVVVLENVHGAFSSNKGEDFRAVVEEFCSIQGGRADIPRPDKGKWADAGGVVGEGYSFAWRVLDAQLMGVPQRRRRIYAVLALGDYRGERAGEILFKPQGERRNTAPSQAPWQRFAGDVESGAYSMTAVATQQGGAEIREDDICPTITAAADMSGNNQPYIAFHLTQDPISSEDCAPCLSQGNSHGGQATVGVCAAFMGGQGSKAGGLGYQEEVSPTLKASPSGGNTVPTVVYGEGSYGDYDEGKVSTLKGSGGAIGGGSETLIVSSDDI